MAKSDEQRAIMPERLSDELCREIACRAGVWPTDDQAGVPRAFFEAIRKYHAAMVTATADDGDGLIAISRVDYAILRGQQAPQVRADESVRIALRNLAAEVGGLLGLQDASLREIHGNTNINILERRLNEADAALAANPQQSNEKE